MDTKLLSAFAHVLLTCNNDQVMMRRVFERIAITTPEAVLTAARDVGITSGFDVMPVARSINFPLEFINIEIFEEVKATAYSVSPNNTSPKVQAIKLLRTKTGCGLKEAKDFVEYYFPTF